MTTLHLRKSSGRSPLRLGLPRVQRIWIIRGFFLIPLVLACFALSPTPNAFGVTPAPDGGYPGENTAEGTDALFNLTTGIGNTAIGFNALFNNTTGNRNTANGDRALQSNTTGVFNLANGNEALFSNTTGNRNTANGVAALHDNTTGSSNTANGYLALFSNTTGNSNTANGVNVLQSNTTGIFNTANGNNALFSNTTGHHNTANGADALFSNTTGFNNAANGVGALFNNTTGSSNTATGVSALEGNITGNFNTANGGFALFHNTSGEFNTANGVDALRFNTTGNNNIALGGHAGQNLTTGSNNIDVGNVGIAAEANTIRIGTQGIQTATYIAGISETPIGGGGSTIRVNANGQLGTAGSSARFKQNIEPMDKASEAIQALKPVTFRYKQEFDAEGVPQFGLVAEEVEKVNPDLVTHDAKGELYSVRYEAVNAMLLNEFLKEHRTVQEQKATIAQLKEDFRATVVQLTARLKEQDSKIEKVSAQVEVSKAAPQTVLNNQ